MDVGSNTFLVLPSNSREENKSSDFTTLLPYQLSLRGGQWEAGITEIICNSHFDNVSEPLNFSIDYYDGESQEFILPAGTYTSGQILISSIQSLIDGTRPNLERKLSRKSKHFFSIRQRDRIRNSEIRCLIQSLNSQLPRGGEDK